MEDIRIMNVRELFSNISGTYDLLNRALSLGIDQRWRKKSVGLLPHGREVKVLDLASGTLDMALHYVRRGEGQVYAVDFALPMLLTGRYKVSPTLDERIHLIGADAKQLPFPNQFFDAVMCAWGVRNFNQLTQTLTEIKRVLKVGGTLLVVEFFRPTRPFSKAFAKTYGRYVMPAIGRFVSKDHQAYDYLHRSIQGFYSREEYEILLKELGFEIAAAKDLSGGISSLILAHVHGNAN